MKKTIFLSLFSLFFIGCTSIDQVEPDAQHNKILIKAKACSYSLENAKTLAVQKLSNQLVSSIKHNFTSKQTKYAYNYQKTYSSNIDNSFNIHSAFISITPKYIENIKKSPLIFGDDEFCSTIIIDNDLLRRYEKLAVDDFRKVQTDISFYSGKIKFSDKSNVINRIITQDSSIVDEYAKLYQVIRIFPSTFNLPQTINKEVMSKYLNAKPTAEIEVDTTDVFYNQPISINLNIQDEEPDLVKISWKIDGKNLKEVTPAIDYNFSSPGRHKIQVTLEDMEGYTSTIKKIIILKNLPPISNFYANKKTFKDKEKIYLTSSAYDPESELKYITYTYHKKGKKKYYKFRNKQSFKYVGTYIITQIIKDKYGKRASSSIKIKVQNLPPVASFSLPKTTYKVGEVLNIKSHAYDPEHHLISTKYKLVNLNNKNEVIKINPKSKIYKVGKYKIVQTVRDRYGNRKSFSKNIQVNTAYFNRLYKNMSLNKAKKIIHRSPLREEKIGFFNFSDYAYDFGDYWLLFYDNKLKCIVYKEEYTENKDCNSYNYYQLSLK